MPKRTIKRRTGEGILISGPAVIRVRRGVTLVIEAPGRVRIGRLSRGERANPPPNSPPFPKHSLPPCDQGLPPLSSAPARQPEATTSPQGGTDDVNERHSARPEGGASTTVLFLCTGNFYRSRFAEIYFNWLAQRDGLHFRADSRGLALDPGNLGEISLHTRVYLGQLGIPLPDPVRFPIDAAERDFESARLVVALKEAEHRPLMQSRFPHWAEQVEYWRVHDLDYALPTEALPQVKRHVEELYERLRQPPS